MNSNPNVIFQLRSLLQNAQSVLIALGKNVDEDTVAAGLALYLTFSKMRKQVAIISPDDIKVERAHLFAIDKISKALTGDNTLIVSLPYKEGNIEKVSYNIEGDKFNLVIEPRGAALDFKPEDIQYNFGRGDYDMIVVLGASQLSDLGDLYENHRNLFSQKPIVTISKQQEGNGFGRVNLVENAPISQTVALTLKTLRIPLEQDPASNLYTGILSHAKDITLETASPDTLETIAFLLRAKAQLLQRAEGNKHASFQQQNTRPAVKVQSSQNGMQENGTLSVEEAPEEWLKPKIFTTKPGGN